MKNSQRHHYLPEFYIKGFGNDSGELWVYDKVADKITKGTRSPKQIFYEWNLNTVRFEGVDFDLIEKAFSTTDDLIAKYFIRIRDTENIDLIEDMSHIGHLIAFIAQLFWRTPANEEITSDLLAFYKMSKPDWESFKAVDWLSHLDDETRMKLLRPLLPMQVLKDKGTNSPDPIRFKILQTFEPFLIGDNPILFKRTPKNIDDFSDSVIFPISKNRVFLGLENVTYKLGRDEIQLTNLLLMLQSKKFVACESKEYLQRLVNGYQHFKAVTSEEKAFMVTKLFKAINNYDGGIADNGQNINANQSISE